MVSECVHLLLLSSQSRNVAEAVGRALRAVNLPPWQNDFDTELVSGKTRHKAPNKLHALTSAVMCCCVMHAKHAQPSVYTVETYYPYTQHSAKVLGSYCMLLVSSCRQGESLTSARLKCCQSFNSPGGSGLERKRFSLLWKQKRHYRQHYAIGSNTIALFELCLSFKLICCLAHPSAQLYLNSPLHF